MKPAISVVTPTHDRQNSVLRLLRALGDGGIPPETLEVLVVADGCSDDTVEAVRTERFAFPVHVLEQTPGRGSAAARNLGAAQARGELLVFLDDDIEPFPGMLAAHGRAHRHLGTPAAVLGASHPVRRLDADWRTVATWDWWDEQFVLMGRPGHRFRYDNLFSGNLSIPAELFALVGGFDADILCRHDYELGLRLIRAGARVAFEAAAGGWHHESRDRAGFQERKVEEGRGDVALVRRHPGLWPVLWISRPMPRATTMKGLLRRLAFAAPRLGDVVAKGLGAALSFFEHLRMRAAWARTSARLTYYGYWRGVASSLGSPGALKEIRRAAEQTAVSDAEEIDLDLRQGLGTAEERLDRERPDGVRLRFGSLPVGRIPPQAGAEPLRGAHLRPALANDHASSLVAALDASAAVGDARSWGPPDPALPAVSVIVPAYNAGETLAETLESLIAQTHPRWEAIVVDDGSTDDTAAVAERFAELDPRIQVVPSEHRGGGQARNTGMASAQHDWLLFLDADDRIPSSALERLGGALAADKSLDAVHGGWARVTGDGAIADPAYRYQTGDLFRSFAEYCVFPIHTCLVKKTCAQRVGGFDPTLKSCQDWDFWQRVARAGARFGRVPETVALYSMRAGSTSSDSGQLLRDGLGVITRGHEADPRVPDPVHPIGAPGSDLQRARLRFAAVSAGLMIGGGRDSNEAIAAVGGDRAPNLSAYDVAEGMFVTVPQPHAHSLDAWDRLWPLFEDPIRDFLKTLERASGAWRLARRAGLILESLTLDVSLLPRPFTRGATLAVRLEVTEPLSPVRLPEGVERLHCAIEVQGERIGNLLLPACDSMVMPEVLADAIDDEQAWKLLYRFFRRHHYRTLRMRRGPNGIEVSRGGAIIEESIPDEAAVDSLELHDRIGWTTFLQDLWARPGWGQGHFYDVGTDDLEDVPVVEAVDGVAVELSKPLPSFRTGLAELEVEYRIGGVPIGLMRVAPMNGVVRPQQLRSVITSVAGLELVRLAVREGLLGRPLDAPGTLRERLSAIADSRTEPTSSRHRIPELDDALFIGRNNPIGMGGALDRRTQLPREAAGDLIEAARRRGQPVLRIGAPGEPALHVVHYPDLVWRNPEPGQPTDRADGSTPSSEDPTNPGRRHFDRHHFETAFAARRDPWGYASPYEQLKYEQTIALLPQERIEAALEVGCAEGRFTQQLAPRVERLTAADISAVALERAAWTCSSFENIEWRRLDLMTDPLPGRFDLIVCSEILYFMGDREALLGIAEKLARALNPDGHLLMTHSDIRSDDPHGTGFEWDVPFGAKTIGDTFASLGTLRFRHELRSGLYRIQLFQKINEEASRDVGSNQPGTVGFVPHVPRSVTADRTRSGNDRTPGGRQPREIVTARLPILLYHRVAPADDTGPTRYRIAPRAFEEQLRYLHELGFFSVDIERWGEAMRTRRPLAGRAVMLTFDDGFEDFELFAWPLLRRYGFTATMFVIADQNGASEWHTAPNDHGSLLGWDAILRMQREGVVFGSHSLTHRHMTGLSNAEIVREAARSRAVLEERLGQSVSSFAYPYGDTDRAVQRLVGACGYRFGFTSWPESSGLQSDPLALPRIEISGYDDLPTFIAKLGT